MKSAPSRPNGGESGLLALLCLFAAIWAVGIPSRAAAAESPENLQKKLAGANEPKQRARILKDLGDAYIAGDKVDLAAGSYLQALETARESFTLGERLQMAIRISWADRLAESTRELKLILAEDSKNLAARTHLARVLSWSGDLSEAIVQADLVLRESPDHQDALLVKADALQWQGRFGEAIPIYRKLLGRNGDFDARIGLAYAYLGGGNRTGAIETARGLKPANSRQERALARLTAAMQRETSPALDARYNHYGDSDENKLNRYALLYSFWAGNVNLAASFRHTNARDDVRSNRAEDFVVSAYTRLTDVLGVGGGLGFSQLHDGDSSTFGTGHVKADLRVLRGSAGLSVTRELLSDTAELIKNRIRLTNVALYLSHPLTERVNFHGGYSYKHFSDGNHANDLQLVTRYTFYRNPDISIGHRFRLLDYHTQRRNGYFDPNNYIANRIFGAYYIERDWFYTYMDIFVGHQTFRRNEVASDDFIHGGTAALGLKPLPNLAIEVNVEGGTFAAGSASGFNYLNIGPRILFRF
ncbi:MAG TPA: hypothetical protein VNN77_19130 [candidate division Zixibacteria bacterium]|nr:hypothetical protein [candidate division Zixibacteria bacterium]